jgi:FMN reductase
MTYVVGIGGTLRPDSSSERALRHALQAAADAGAQTELFAAADIELPMYDPTRPGRDPRAERLVAAVARADGVVIASPGYHGGISGLVKNALDYVEDLRSDERPYLDGRAVGCIVCAHGWQAAVTTLESLRSIVHALRGWPTPLGVAINAAEPVFDRAGAVVREATATQLELMAGQVVDFARLHGESSAGVSRSAG